MSSPVILIQLVSLKYSLPCYNLKMSRRRLKRDDFVGADTRNEALKRRQMSFC